MAARDSETTDLEAPPAPLRWRKMRLAPFVKYESWSLAFLYGPDGKYGMEVGTVNRPDGEDEWRAYLGLPDDAYELVGKYPDFETAQQALYRALGLK